MIQTRPYRELAAALEIAGFESTTAVRWVKGTVSCAVGSAFVTVQDSTNPGAKCVFSYQTAVDMAAKGQL